MALPALDPRAPHDDAGPHRYARFAGAVERYRHSAELVGILDGIFGEKTLAEWTRILAAHRLIWAPVATLEEAVRDEQAAAFGSFPSGNPSVARRWT
jgi:crotonobetainyl-CoA:carnitine CoA-transferase CaiB-like acyl-CoA transferase